MTKSFDKSVVVPLSPDETFALLTEPDRLRRWQAVTARIDVRAGGDYRFTIVPGHSAAGKVKEVEPGRRLVLSWGWEDADDLPPGASTITITLEPTDGGTSVRLVHEGLTAEQLEGHAAGWNHYLERLVIAARSGDAGADDWMATVEGIDALTAAEASLAICQLVLRGLGDADGTAPTPCTKYTVDDLVEHLVGSIVGVGGMAGATIEPPTDGTAEHRVATTAQAALEAWRARGTEGEVTFGAGTLPASIAANILALEFLVHAWDFGRASSQDVPVKPELSAAVLEQAHLVIAPAMRDGDRFAAEVTVPEDASALDRLVGFTGRTP
jgi:uncharacterized protein (TIGR03086 family)